MDPQCALALRVEEDVDAVVGIGVHGRHDEARIVGADRDQAEVKGSAVLADLFEGRTVREVGVLFAVVEFGWGQGRDGAVASSGRSDCVWIANDQSCSDRTALWTYPVSPPNHTFLPPETTLQLDHSVCALSNGVRAEVC